MSKEDAKKEVDKWEGHYMSNDFQEVTDKDAANMSEALKKALKDKEFRSKTDPAWIKKIEGFIKFLDHGSFAIG